jgi:hypothetical protein
VTTAAVVGLLLVEVEEPGFGNLAQLRERVKQVGVDQFVGIGLVDAFDERALLDLPDCMKRSTITVRRTIH